MGSSNRPGVSLRELIGGTPLRFRVSVRAQVVTGTEPNETIAALAAWAGDDDARSALLLSDPLKACEEAGVKLSARERDRAQRFLRSLGRRELPGNVDLEDVNVKVAVGSRARAAERKQAEL